MSLLPQLEAELVAAHERRFVHRRRRRSLLSGLVAVAGVAVAIVVVVFALSARRAPVRHVAAPPAAPPAVIGAGPRPFALDLTSPQVFALGRSVYVTQRFAPNQGELVQIAAASGHTVDVTQFGGTVQDIVRAAGRLWLVTDTGSGAALWSLDPERLTGKVVAALSPGAQPSLAAAGDAVWVSSGSGLQRYAPGSPVLSLPKGRGGGEIAMNAAGSLLAYVHGDTAAEIEFRDGRTGRLLHRTTLPPGRVRLAGVAGTRVWLTWTNGARAYLEGLSPGVLGANGSPRVLRAVGPNTKAFIAAGALWVGDPSGAPRLNYCARPTDGRPVTEWELGARRAIVAADAQYLYSLRETPKPNAAALFRVATGRHCP